MVKDTLFNKKRLLNLRGNMEDLTIPKIMGILNITPDSFYDGGFYQAPDKIRKRVNELLKDGADIIDVGAYSSRPNADHISSKEEFSRLKTALEIIRKDHPEVYLSVDTFRAEIARQVVEEFQVNMINDISGGILDSEMAETIAKLQVPYVMMHMPGDPKTMQSNTDYIDIIREIIEFLGKQTQHLKTLGVNDILIDPGFGFGKTLEQNYKLLSHLDSFKLLGLPIMVGISRKSMIYSFLDISPEEALNGTTALHMMALERGADILRVHDIKEAIQTVKLFTKVREEL